MSQRIAKYEVLEKIAEGGFGTVYKARDPFIKRLVAIKTCSVADEDMARRFFREAEIAGRFDHPNVTIVHDFGVEDQTAYLVQEYLTGEDLLQKIRRRDPLPLRQKVDYLLQVANGLAYAHSQQVIHRDIKPANLRVLETGQVKILDFGIAKLATATTQLTQKGMAVGTLGYLSPEQLRDQELDTRTDIFSYGVVAYELLTYARPFQGKQLSALMDEILHRTPAPIVQHVVDCPPALERVVARCLEKDRDLRYQTFDEVAADLEEVRRELTASRPVAEGASASVPPPIADRASASGSRPGKASGDGGPITRPIRLPPAQPAAPAPPPVAWPAPGQRGAPPPPPPLRAAAETAASRPQEGDDAGGVAIAPPPLLPPPPPLPPLAAPPRESEPGSHDSARAAVASGPATAPPAAAPMPGPSATGAAPAAPRAPGSGLPWKWIVAAGIGMLLVLAVGAWLLSVLARKTAPAAPAATAAASDAAAPVTTGAATVIVLGTPWGELASLQDAAGRELPLPARRETPLVLALPPGHYLATLRHPNAPAPASCQVDAAAGQAATCRAELLPIAPLQYFKEAGWWK